MPVKKGLGRGLSALISDTEEEYDGALKESDNTPKDAAVEISISLIDPNVNQPRKNFDDAGLLELTNSIRVHGIISPIILVPVAGCKKFCFRNI